MTGDWADILVELAAVHARFLVVGAHALAVQGVPRATQDLDIWVDPTPENADRVWTALVRFGAPLEALGIEREDFVRPETVVQIGLPPNRVDFLTTISGVTSFSEAWTERVDAGVDGQTVPFLGRRALIANKRAAGRLKDLADIEALGEEV